MNAPYNQDVLAAAEACFAQASQLLYCEPDAEVVADQVAERPFQNAPFGMDDADVREGMALMDAWCVAAAADEAGFDERVAALRREWLRLFVGAGTPDAPSWESFYRDPNSQLFSARTLEVREQYRRHGLQIERLHAEPDDHLGLMLGFMAHLCGAEADALAAGDEAALRELRAEQEGFLEKHVLPWLAAWRYEVGKHAASDYYRGAGELAFGLCARYAQRFGIAFDEDAQAFKRTVAVEEA